MGREITEASLAQEMSRLQGEVRGTSCSSAWLEGKQRTELSSRFKDAIQSMAGDLQTISRTLPGPFKKVSLEDLWFVCSQSRESH